MSILSRIVAVKREEIAERRRRRSFADAQHLAKDQAPTRAFKQRIESFVAMGKAAVIAEIKRASPSKGVLREPYHPAEIAASYADAGAACLSVLTDQQFFQGQDDHLLAARAACALPVLRKDFCVDVYQVFETRALGADAMLLIVACLSDGQLQDLYGQACELALDVLVEVHDASELKRALPLSKALLGINNRDLNTFESKLSTTIDLLPSIPAGRIKVSESGILLRSDVELLRRAGVEALLIGEAFMRAPNPGLALQELVYS